MSKTIKDANILLGKSFVSEAPRLAHSIGVAKQMEKLLIELNVLDRGFIELCAQAAILHDIGYCVEANRLNFHPIDGYLFVKHHGFDQRVAELILHHSFAKEFCKETCPDLLHYYDGIDLDYLQKEALVLLDYCDLHTSNMGEEVSYGDRIQSIRERYGADHPTYKIMRGLEWKHRAVIGQVRTRLREQI